MHWPQNSVIGCTGWSFQPFSLPAVQRWVYQQSYSYIIADPAVQRQSCTIRYSIVKLIRKPDSAALNQSTQHCPTKHELHYIVWMHEPVIWVAHAFEIPPVRICFVLVSCAFAYREYSVWSWVSFDVPPMEEEPDSSSDSLLCVGGKRRRKTNIASGPPYGYLIFQLAPICRTSGSLTVFTARSISNTSAISESVDKGIDILGQDFSQRASLSCIQLYSVKLHRNISLSNLKGTVWHFGKHVYLCSCRVLVRRTTPLSYLSIKYKAPSRRSLS